MAQQGTRPPMQVFELVAGPGNDYTATAAPALGTPEGTIEVKNLPVFLQSRPATTGDAAADAPSAPDAARASAKASVFASTSHTQSGEIARMHDM